MRAHKVADVDLCRPLQVSTGSSCLDVGTTLRSAAARHVQRVQQACTPSREFGAVSRFVSANRIFRVPMWGPCCVHLQHGT
jgi:hypothetical protein